MKKHKKTEKLLLQEIFRTGTILLKRQRGLSIGELMTLIRRQLGMSQRILAKRSKIPQATISKIESDKIHPQTSTLKRILAAMECNLLITAVPTTDLETARKNQARRMAEQKIRYLHGTMSLEKQAPNQKLLKELFDDEMKKLLDGKSSELWGDNG